MHLGRAEVVKWWVEDAGSTSLTRLLNNCMYFFKLQSSSSVKALSISVCMFVPIMLFSSPVCAVQNWSWGSEMYNRQFSLLFSNVSFGLTSLISIARFDCWKFPGSCSRRRRIKGVVNNSLKKSLYKHIFKGENYPFSQGYLLFFEILGSPTLLKLFLNNFKE